MAHGPFSRCAHGCSIAVLILTAFAASAVAAPIFAPAVSYETGPRPNWVAVGDLNGDGKPDLVTANSVVNTVSILLGNGDGTFAPKVDRSVTQWPEFVLLADLNRDGKLDLVVTGENPDTLVSVLLGNGDGTFGPVLDLKGVRPSSVAVADLDADGKPDLAVTHPGPDGVAVMPGNGDGTFGSFVDHVDQTNSGGPTSVAVGDVNADGHPDLVTANNSAIVAVLLGDGIGGFGPWSPYVTGSNPSQVAIGDLNGDGKLDLVVADHYIPVVSVLLGNGDGTFGPSGCNRLGGTCATSYDGGQDPISVAIGDLDVDGKPDIAVASSGSDAVSVLPGNGDGTFGPRTGYPVGSFPASVAIADVDRDGRPDIVVANYFSNSVSVLRNVTTVSTDPERAPAEFALSSTGPNPFGSAASFALAIPKATMVRVDVCDLQGRRIQTLQNGLLLPGRYTRSWNGASVRGTHAAAGMYIVRLSAPGIERTTKAILIR